MMCVVLGANQANAEVTVKEYRTAMARGREVDAMKVYVKGLGEGVGWANIRAKSLSAPLYCAPPNFAVGLENFLDILDREIELEMKRKMPQAQLDGSMIGLLLVLGLQETFPCARK